jgi:hypothetical protein
MSTPISINEKDEILAELRLLRNTFEKSTNVLARQKPFINDELQKIVLNEGFEIIGINLNLKKIVLDIDAEVREMYKSVMKMERRVKFYYNHLIRERDGYDIEFNDNLTHGEDDLFHIVADYIFKLHDFKTGRVDFHSKIDGIEFDCIARGTTYMGKYNRVVGIEFKDIGFAKVVEQALLRKNYTHLQYIVVGTDPATIYEGFRTLLDELSDNGIGLISIVNVYDKKNKNRFDVPIRILTSAHNNKPKVSKLDFLCEDM